MSHFHMCAESGRKIAPTNEGYAIGLAAALWGLSENSSPPHVANYQRTHTEGVLSTIFLFLLSYYWGGSATGTPLIGDGNIYYMQGEVPWR